MFKKTLFIIVDLRMYKAKKFYGIKHLFQNHYFITSRCRKCISNVIHECVLVSYEGGERASLTKAKQLMFNT